MYSLNKKNIFVVIDSIFPQKDPFAFRNAEINEYIKIIKNFKAYSMPIIYPDNDAWFKHSYGVSKLMYKDNKKGYTRHYPKNKKSIEYLDINKKYKFSLAYTFFLGETYTLLPYLESNEIPFVFVLYPGGCFGLNNIGSDKMLKKIFDSPYFKGVITTQKITTDYLIQNKLCDASKVEYIYGGFVQFRKNDIKQKLIYPTDKKTFDICFVAAKYSEKGRDKGYDLFIETAKILSLKIPNIHFHVIGGFNEEDIDITEIKNKIHFYGYKKPDFLVEFYKSMDIFVSPNRPSELFQGNFDGFPLGIDAGYCGVALFVADELNMNTKYIPGEDIVIISLKPQEIADDILMYYNDLDRLYMLSYLGGQKTQALFDLDKQISQRINYFKKFATIEFGKNK
ncbi:glycosyltransferase [bacterium]|nr:glycosyltransferase [bacterium]